MKTIHCNKRSKICKLSELFTIDKKRLARLIHTKSNNIVPPKSKAESGNLVVSLGEENDATDTRINVEQIIKVVTGSLVLFPASLTHYTIPFEAEEERIVLAFDVNYK